MAAYQLSYISYSAVKELEFNINYDRINIKYGLAAPSKQINKKIFVFETQITSAQYWSFEKVQYCLMSTGLQKPMFNWSI